MKKYAIVLDEKNKKIVITSSWIADDLKYFYFPPEDVFLDIKQAVIDETEPEKNWSKLLLRKVIKCDDTYTTEVANMNIHNIAEMTDPSDQEKMKKSRGDRNRKRMSDDFVPLHSKRKQKKCNPLQSDSEGDSDNENQDIEQKKSSNNVELTPPIELNVSASSNCPQQHRNRNLNLFSSARNLNSMQDETNSSSKAHKDTSVADLQNENDENATLQKMFDLQKLMLQKVNTISIRQEYLDKKLTKLNQSKTRLSGSGMQINNQQAQLIAEYFPINTNPEDANKKIEVVEEKLKEKKFLKVVPYLTPIHLTMCKGLCAQYVHLIG